MMSILTLIHEYPPVGGGGGRVAQDLAEGFVSHGHKVYVLTSAFRGLPPDENRAGVHIRRIKALRKKSFRASFFSMGVYIIHAVWVGWRMIRREKPDCIHAHFAVPAGAAAWILSRLTGIPYVITIHMGDIPGGVPSKTSRWFRLVKPFTPRIWHDAADIISVSSYGKRLASRYYPNVQIKVIPNGVRLDSIARSTLNDPLRLAFIGRFMDEKNPIGFVKALILLKDLPWDAVLVGDGPLMPEVQSLLCDAGLEQRVRLTGWISSEKALEKITQSDVLVIPSFSEGLPVVSVQALAAGVAIVAANVGSLDDVVHNGVNGFLLDEPSPEALSKALSVLIKDNDTLSAMKQASLRLSQSFDLNSILARYEDAISQVLQKSTDK